MRGSHYLKFFGPLALLPSFVSAHYFKSSANHEIKIFNQGAAALEERLQMIERATKSIDVEYFLYDNDEASARIFSQALVRKAKQNVPVRILVDALSLTLKVDDYLAEQFAKNRIEVRYFNRRFILRPIGHHRNHRKHLIIEGNDGFEVMSGGRNIEDKYFDLDRRYNFLDRDAWVKGPIAENIKNTFDSLWDDELTENRSPVIAPRPVPRADGRGTDKARFDQEMRRHRQKLAHAEDFLKPNARDLKVRNFVNEWAAKQAINVGRFTGPVSYVSDESHGGWSRLTGKKRETKIWNRLKLVFNETQKTVLAESPYLIVPKKGMILIEELRNRSIPLNLNLLTNSPFSTDSQITATSYAGFSKRIAETGMIVKVYDATVPNHYRETTPPISLHSKWGVHAKTMVFDSKNTAIGSFNLDPLSKNINIEAVLYFPDNPALATFVENDIRDRQEHSFEFFVKDPDTAKLVKKFSDCHKMSFYECFMFRIQRPLSRLMIGLL